MYYLSHALIKVEEKHTSTEKLSLSLYFACVKNVPVHVLDWYLWK
jgi:hypothetical protein